MTFFFLITLGRRHFSCERFSFSRVRLLFLLAQFSLTGLFRTGASQRRSCAFSPPRCQAGRRMALLSESIFFFRALGEPFLCVFEAIKTPDMEVNHLRPAPISKRLFHPATQLPDSRLSFPSSLPAGQLSPEGSYPSSVFVSFSRDPTPFGVTHSRFDFSGADLFFLFRPVAFELKILRPFFFRYFRRECSWPVSCFDRSGFFFVFPRSRLSHPFNQSLADLVVRPSGLVFLLPFEVSTSVLLRF